MRSPSRRARRLAVATLVLIAGSAALLGVNTMLSGKGLAPANAGALDRTVAIARKVAAPTTTTTAAPVAPVAPVAVPPAHVFATGNAQLDALLPTLPALLFEGGAHVHYGYNPLDSCCHAGGYNPEPNDAWIGPSAFTSASKLTYVTVHELAHSVHIKTARATALTAAVAGAPVVRAGPWDDSEKVADCVAWVLYPTETAASGITYWGCPDPGRSQVRAALG
ncbi:MAG: hypothetical protein ACXVKA_01790 [Acidimicrobiia bacterium]